MKSVPLRLVGDKNHIRTPLPMATSVRAFCCLSVFAQPVIESCCQDVAQFLGRDFDPFPGGVVFGVIVTPAVIVLPGDLPGLAHKEQSILCRRAACSTPLTAVCPAPASSLPCSKNNQPEIFIFF